MSPQDATTTGVQPPPLTAGPAVRDDGWSRWSIWEHSDHVARLYAQRSRREAEEMTCAAQAAELLAERVKPGDTVLDVGCGSGYFFHSLTDRDLDVEYWGVDGSARLIDIGRRIMPEHGLPAERLVYARIDDLDGQVDHVVCMNTISNVAGFHRPLERMLAMARRTVILRESLGAGTAIRYVVDEHLNPGVRLRVHVNRYDIDEVCALVCDAGFAPTVITDRRTGGEAELVIGHPHHWTFLLATREDEEGPA